MQDLMKAYSTLIQLYLRRSLSLPRGNYMKHGFEMMSKSEQGESGGRKNPWWETRRCLNVRKMHALGMETRSYDFWGEKSDRLACIVCQIQLNKPGMTFYIKLGHLHFILYIFVWYVCTHVYMQKQKMCVSTHTHTHISLWKTIERFEEQEKNLFGIFSPSFPAENILFTFQMHPFLWRILFSPRFTWWLLPLLYHTSKVSHSLSIHCFRHSFKCFIYTNPSIHHYNPVKQVYVPILILFTWVKCWVWKY